MPGAFRFALAAGYEFMAAWSDLLDDINLYPVADADTGRNLRISLSPLRIPTNGVTTETLLLCASGNSGNIAGAFFAEFIAADTTESLASAIRRGSDAAWKSVQRPQSGTMLSVFDALVGALSDTFVASPEAISTVLERLKSAVISTAGILPALKRAKVVDAGALGMFLFFEGFFKSLTGQTDACNAPEALFGDLLRIDGDPDASSETAWCIDAVLRPSGDREETVRKISDLGDHVVAIPSGGGIKIHFHATDRTAAQEGLGALGELVRFDPEKIEAVHLRRPGADPAPVHIATDAAGSLSWETARQLGVTLLDSYVVMAGRSIPETLVSPDTLYHAMRKGVPASTAQASLFERQKSYESLTARHEQVVYLCVGSVYTGNHRIASQWAASRPEGQAMTVIDTGAASGRLGLIAHHTARFAAAGNGLPAVLDRVRSIGSACDELVFLDQLKYLAAGGRLSRTKGFFGDLLHLKPVIRPTSQGAQKAGVVKSQQAQIDFAVQHLKAHRSPNTAFELLFCHTDNRDWVLLEAKPAIEAAVPVATSFLQPMSLTSGVHMGPGTWAVAFLPVPADGRGA